MQVNDISFWSPCKAFVEVTGPDATSFLNRLTTRNIETSGTNCFLDARGRLVDVVWQQKIANDSWVLMSAHETSEKLFNWLGQFWFTENIEIKKLHQNPGIEVSAWLRVGEAERIARQLPRAPTEINESFNPLEIGLESTIGQNRGCYPGQEAIERLRVQEKVSKILVSVACQEKDFGTMCQSSEITSHVDSWQDGHPVALAVLKKTALTDNGLFTTSNGVNAWVVSSAR